MREQRSVPLVIVSTGSHQQNGAEHRLTNLDSTVEALTRLAFRFLTCPTLHVYRQPHGTSSFHAAIHLTRQATFARMSSQPAEEVALRYATKLSYIFHCCHCTFVTILLRLFIWLFLKLPVCKRSTARRIYTRFRLTKLTFSRISIVTK